MASLEVALEAAPVALLVVGPVAVVVRQDIAGECGMSVQYGSEPPQRMQRFAYLAEVLAYLAGGVVPGVRGDEDEWMPMEARQAPA